MSSYDLDGLPVAIAYLPADTAEDVLKAAIDKEIFVAGRCVLIEPSHDKVSDTEYYHLEQ